MNKEDYTLRIAQATPVQLVIINHELIVDFISAALEAMEKDDIQLFEQNINKAKDALMPLMDGADLENPIAQELFVLYMYAGRRLNKAFFGRDTEAAQEILEMFRELLEGWQSIEHTPDDRLSEDPAEDAPHVYAGLTYGKDGGLEEYIPQDESRGFKA